jgi:uncharacterized protein (TIGR02996 family)
MTDLEALRRAIVTSPEEHTPRLAYADELDAIGGVANARCAEFIRLQIEIANRPYSGRCGNHWCKSHDPCDKHIKWLPQDEREMILWGRYPECNDVRGWVHDNLPKLETGTWSALPMTLTYQTSTSPLAVVSGGFVSRVVTEESLFNYDDVVRDLFRLNPVTEVVLANKEPRQRGPSEEHLFTWQRDMSDIDGPAGGWHYYADYINSENVPATRSKIPGPIFDFLPPSMGTQGGFYFVIRKFSDWRYGSRDDALVALSKACVRYGRTMAGLHAIKDE